MRQCKFGSNLCQDTEGIPLQGGEGGRKKISATAMTLATLYALVFDGWSEASKHFIGMYIVFPAKEVDADRDLYLLAFAPLHDDETYFTAENHANFINTTLIW